MTQYGWISLIALTGWLVLALGSYRAHRIGAKKTLVMATAWLGLFMLVTGILVAVGV
jgi:hypothetical protein